MFQSIINYFSRSGNVDGGGESLKLNSEELLTIEHKSEDKAFLKLYPDGKISKFLRSDLSTSFYFRSIA